MKHPGTIEHVDGETGRVLKTVAAAEVPEDQRFAPDEHGHPTPITRVVRHQHGERVFIREYGPGGVLLRSTAATAR